MKFKFKLEPVLKHRKIKEDIAKKDYAEAESKVQECLSVINSYYNQIEETRSLSLERQQLGGSVTAYLDFNSDLILGIKIKIEIEKLKVRDLMQVAEEKKEILIEARREKKIVESLKQKKMEEFKKLQKKHEQKQIDEMVSQRYARIVNE